MEQRIERAGGGRGRVRILAVTKTFPASWAKAAFDAGLHDLGENYAAELVEKAAALDELPIRWHYLGAIQTNKVGRLAPVTAVFEGLARDREALAIATRRPGATVMVQVEMTGLPGRNGCPPEQVAALVERARSLGLEVSGLMTVAPIEPERARACFRRVRGLADDLELAECSMGMTDDLELAVEEGSTMVRVGRALFGSRTARG